MFFQKKSMLAIVALIFIIAISNSQYTNGPFPRSDHICDNLPGFFWDGQKCEVCENQNCFCGSKGVRTCDRCVSGYGLYQFSDYISTCYQCGYQGSNAGIDQCCFDGLQTNWSPNIAANQHQASFLSSRASNCLPPAQSGSYWIIYVNYGGYCLTIQYCQTYNVFAQCTSCQNGYYLAISQSGQNAQTPCVACSVANCLQCQAQSQCSKCKDNFYMETNNGRDTPDTTITLLGQQSCKQCNSGCYCSGNIVSSQPQTCDRGCLPSYYQSQTNVCTLCSSAIQNCILCSNQNNVAFCNQCQNDTSNPTSLQIYVIDTTSNNSKCVQCPSNCYNCAFNETTKQTYCLPNSCQNGYYPSGGSCLKCTQAFASRCSDANTILQCHSTGDQYLDFNSNTPPHNTGQQSYYLNKINGQLKCQQNINDCKQMNAGDITCATCYAGFQLVNGICKVCPTGCVNGQCQLVTDQSTSQQYLNCSCINNIDNDVAGDVVNSDTKVSYYMDRSTNLCVKGQNGCKTYAFGGNCTACQKGFYNQDTTAGNSKKCAQCQVASCANCDNQTTSNLCQSCFPGFQLYTDVNGVNTCQPCQYGCASCNSQRTQCSACLSGFYLQNNACQDVRANCVVWNLGGGACQTCAYGYRQTNGYCFPTVSSGLGYVNEAFNCNNPGFRYQQDGNLLGGLPNPSESYGYTGQLLSQSYLQISIALLAILLMLF